MKFRSDINGLRAVAVLFVVLFHFDVPGFQGGFIGVDVFFVISGYLMTAIIFSPKARSSFSLVDFYLARARRIIPALVVLCLVVVAVGWFILIPNDYRALAKHAGASVGFLSNFIYWTEAGYFDAASHDKWLLHTWSLSVEWQFYLLYPVLILALRRHLHTRGIRNLLAILTLLSFILSIYGARHWPNAAFYLLPTRAWEMLAGALVFLYPLKSAARAPVLLQWSGMAVIVFSAVFFSAADLWPGWLAAIPVLGAVLVLYAAHSGSRLTGNPVAQKLGDVSYSVYLWHWPIVVALGYYEQAQAPLWILTGVAMSLLLGYGSYRFVEQPLRRLGQGPSHQGPSRREPNHWRPALQQATLVLSVVLVASAIFTQDGVPARVDEVVVQADSERRNRNPRASECNVRKPELESPGCIFGGNGKDVGVIMIGDSHANATITALAAAIPENEGGALLLSAGGCMSLLNISSKHFPQCGEFNRKIRQFLKQEYPGVPLVVVNRTTSPLLGNNERQDSGWTYLNQVSMSHASYPELFRQEYLQAVCELAQTRQVYITKPIPEMQVDVPQALIKASMIGIHQEPVQLDLGAYHERHQLTLQMMEEARADCGAELLDPVPFLCSDDQCPGTRHNRPLYYDSNHLSEYGNRFLTPMFGTLWSDKDTAETLSDSRGR